ncbi:MAG: MarC family protein [Candidatus Latescibacteria bacterium]|nr:MarC family protein [bacterium]MBD3423967.1 MarC family protein [Candidatus Latescibacterota bacterium]
MKSTGLMLVLLNPFLVIVYLVDAVKKLDRRQFRAVLVKAGLIAAPIFCCFVLLGSAIFTDIIQAEFASFRIFGGVIFLIIGLQFVFRGTSAIEGLRGESKQLVGSIAMPILVGPGTISASVVIGQRHDSLTACGAVVAGVAVCVIAMIVLKSVHDFVLPRRERLIDRYIEVAGRITALFVGTISVEMIMQGIRSWIEKI